MGHNHLVSAVALGAGTTALLWRATSLPTGAEDPHPLPLGGWVGDGARAVWGWLFPLDLSAPLGWGYVALAAGLFLVGSLLPDVDSPKSLLGRRLGHWTGPHRGLPHTDWALWALFAVALIPGMRLVAFVWLGALLHCELDGWSTGGRVRFWPLTAHKVITLPGGSPCVVRRRPRRPSYRVGGPSEVVAVLFCAGLGTAAAATALLL